MGCKSISDFFADCGELLPPSRFVDITLDECYTRYDKLELLRLGVVLYPYDAVLIGSLANQIFKNHTHANIFFARRLVYRAMAASPFHTVPIQVAVDLELSVGARTPAERNIVKGLINDPSSASLHDALGRLVAGHRLYSRASYFVSHGRLFGTCNGSYWRNRFEAKLLVGQLSKLGVDLRRTMILDPSSSFGEKKIQALQFLWVETDGFLKARNRRHVFPGWVGENMARSLGAKNGDPTTLAGTALKRLKRLISCSPGYRVESEDVAIITALAWSGRTDQIYQLVRRLRRLAEMPYMLRQRIMTTQLVCRLSLRTEKFRFPVKSGPRTIVSLPVWGGAHAEAWMDVGARSLLEPSNRAALERGNKMMVVYTDHEGLRIFSRHHTFRELRDVLAINVVNLFEDKPASDWILPKGERLAASQWCSLLLARRQNAHCLMLAPDGIYSNGSLVTIEEKIRDAGCHGLYASDFDISWDAGIRLGCATREDANVFHSESLLRILRRNMSDRLRSRTVYAEGKINNLLLNGDLLFFEGKYCQIINTHPTQIYFSPEAMCRLWPLRFTTTDSGSLDWTSNNFSDDKAFEILSDPRKFLMLGMQKQDEPVDFVPFEDCDFEQSVRSLIAVIKNNRWNTRGRRAAIGAPCIISGDQKQVPSRIRHFIDILLKEFDTLSGDDNEKAASEMWRAFGNLG